MVISADGRVLVLYPCTDVSLVYYSIQALGRSETRRDGGYKHNWSFSHSGDSEEERIHE